MTLQEAYKKGFIDGITAYAHWKDGIQEVGTIGTTLRRAKANIEDTWNYSPPEEVTCTEL